MMAMEPQPLSSTVSPDDEPEPTPEEMEAFAEELADEIVARLQLEA